MLLRRYFLVYWLLATWNLVNAGFISLLYVQFYRRHVSIHELLFAEAIAALIVVIAIAVRHTVSTRRDMMLGFLSVGLALCLLLLPWSISYFYLHVILRGLGSIVFYVPCNIIFFNNTAENARARSMSWYWSVGIITGIVGPLLGSFIFVHFGQLPFLFCALSFLVVAIFLMTLIVPERYAYTLPKLARHIDRLRVITALDGALHRVPTVVSIFAVLYVAGEVDYGYYLSGTAVVALLVSFVVARASDKTRRRMIYITPFSIAGFLVTALFFFARTPVVFFGLALVLKMVNVLCDPLRSTIILDRFAPSALTWLSRELYLNIGRTVFLAIAGIFAYFGAGRILFVFLALPFLLFPFLVHRRGIYRIVPEAIALE